MEKGLGIMTGILWTTLPRNRVIIPGTPFQRLPSVARRDGELARQGSSLVTTTATTTRSRAPRVYWRDCGRDVPRAALGAVGVAADEGRVEDQVAVVDEGVGGGAAGAGEEVAAVAEVGGWDRTRGLGDGGGRGDGYDGSVGEMSVKGLAVPSGDGALLKINAD